MAYKPTINPFTSKLQLVNDPTAAISVPQLNADPALPSAEDMWVLKSGGGIMQTSVSSLKYLLGKTPATYRLSYRTNEGTTIRVQLS